MRRDVHTQGLELGEVVAERRELQARLAVAVRRKGKGGGQEEAAALRAQIKPLETKQAWGGRQRGRGW